MEYNVTKGQLWLQELYHIIYSSNMKDHTETFGNENLWFFTINDMICCFSFLKTVNVIVLYSMYY